MSGTVSSPQTFQSRARLSAIGSYVPEAILTNEDMEKLVDTDNEWIVRRTGIITRHKAAENEFASDLAVKAVGNLLDRYGVDPSEIDGIIVATSTGNYRFPSVAAYVQKTYGMKRALSFDLNAACAGFVYALQMANALILTGAHRKILAIGVDTLTKITDYTDRSTCILFGDGAGAVLIEAAEEGAFLASYASTEGAGGHHVYASNVSKIWEGQPLLGEGKLVQNGREVYKWALSTIPGAVREMLSEAGYEVKDLDWFVPHSANLRMIEALCERLDFPLEKTLESVVHNGNTSAATIPLALDAAVREKKLAPGHLLALFGFGSGLTQAGTVLRWTAEAK
jgi:3-oxoacyl-[acyl-carrier-protein] synthase-3